MRRFHWCIFKLTLNDDTITLINRSGEYGGEVPATDEFIDLFRRKDGSIRDHIFMRGLYDNLTGRVTQMSLAGKQGW